jgi:hypothetical protein
LQKSGENQRIKITVRIGTLGRKNVIPEKIFFLLDLIIKKYSILVGQETAAFMIKKRLRKKNYRSPDTKFLSL